MNKSSLQYLLHPTRLLVRMDQKCIIHLRDETYLRWLFKWKLGYELDLDNPQTFNEKIQWLKLHDKQDRYTKLVDKYEAKKIVGAIIGDEYIIPTLGVWDTFDEIDFDLLPNQFVLKTTHDSGSVFIVKSKELLDIEKIKIKMMKSLNKNYYNNGREWPYKNVRPRIICEKYIQNNDETLNDYKIFVFNGKVKCAFTCTERFSKEGLKVTFFDTQWNVMPFERHYPKSSVLIKKPQNFELMIELAERLAEGIRFVRVDFYEVNGKVYFGEMTFYPGSGMEEFTPVDWDYKLGDWISIKR